MVFMGSKNRFHIGGNFMCASALITSDYHCNDAKGDGRHMNFQGENLAENLWKN